MSRIALLLGAFVCTQVFAQTPAAAPPAGSLPIESFTKFDEFGGLKISPDGEFAALLTGKYGRSMVMFIDLKTKKGVSGIRVPEDCEIDEYYWVSPTRLIYRRRPGRSSPSIATAAPRGSCTVTAPDRARSTLT
jgi:hypothetical protein